MLSTITEDLTSQSAQLFESALFAFRASWSLDPDALDLEEYIRTWTQLLAKHHHEEVRETGAFMVTR